MKRELEALISTLLKEAYSFDSPIELTRPDEKFGDYATNVALQLAKQLSKNPRELAEEISGKIKTAFTDKFAELFPVTRTVTFDSRIAQNEQVKCYHLKMWKPGLMLNGC